MATSVTLQDIKERPLREISFKGYMSANMDDWNIRVWRSRMESPKDRRHDIEDIVRSGNEPRDNEEMLDYARWYVEKNVYTDEQWEKYLIPAINEMIAYNDSFVRWFPGYVVRSKDDGKLWIVEYDYATAFGSSYSRKCRDYTSLSLVQLYEDGHVSCGRCWAEYNDYELVDKDHCQENIAKIRDYHVAGKHQVPYYLDSDIVEMYYKSL